MARQSKAVRQAAILAHVRAGSTRRSAAALAGVPFATFYEWLEGAAFSGAVTKAEAEFEQAAVQRIDRAARQGSWRASLALLERRLPESWQQRSTLAVEGDGIIGNLSPEELSGLRSVQEFLALTEPEREELEREQLRLQIDGADPDVLLELRDRIDRLLHRWPHSAALIEVPERT